ncbi:MAG: BlaI/MecI/CopY family transcriptional regulator [Candidatus Latescibacterota bacterium]|jgi:predicted transcriptional regulator
MARPREEGLTARENQIMQVLWRQGEATVEQIQDQLPAELAGSTVRTLLAILHDKGHVSFRKQGKAKVYRPLTERQEAQTSALRQLTERLFEGSASLLLARLVEEEQVSLEELDALRRKLRRRQGGSA